MTQGRKSLQELYVAPYYLNALHLAAIVNPIQIKSAEFSYQNFKVTSLLDSFNKTPLHYLLCRRQDDLTAVNTMVEYIVDYLEDPQRSSEEIVNIMQILTPLFSFILIRINPKIRDRYLALCCQQPYSEDPLPRFGYSETRKAHNSTPRVDTRTKGIIHKQGVDPVIFTALLPYLDYTPTSNDMFGLIRTLCTIKNEEVFKSSVISKLIDHLWTETKFVTMSYALLYSVFMLLYSIYIGLGQNILGLEITITCLASVILITELIQVCVLGPKYLADLWNILDVIHGFLMIAFMVLRFIDDANNKHIPDNHNQLLTEQWISSLLVLGGYIRWISYLRYFKTTSSIFSFQVY